MIQGMQMLRLDECDLAIAGGVSESIHTFGIFAGFASQGALASHVDPTKASRPFDKNRNGIVVAEGGCLYVLERLSRCQSTKSKDLRRDRRPRDQHRRDGFCVAESGTAGPVHAAMALKRAGLNAEQIDIVSTHATGTSNGDTLECVAVRDVFGKSERTFVNNTKSFIGHAMGAAGAIELAGNMASFDDDMIHPTINVDDLDPDCDIPGLVMSQPRETGAGRLYFEQLVWHAGYQLGTDCQTIHRLI